MLLSPGIKIDSIFKQRKKVPADKRVYFSSLAGNFLTHRAQD